LGRQARRLAWVSGTAGLFGSGAPGVGLQSGALVGIGWESGIHRPWRAFVRGINKKNKLVSTPCRIAGGRDSLLTFKLNSFSARSNLIVRSAW
jgi:hypothetical protein